MPPPTRRQRSVVLRPAKAETYVDIGRAGPPPGLAPYVDYLWWVTWRCREPHVQQVIPLPVVHVYAEARDAVPRLIATGVMTTMFERRLTGTGRTVAAALQPGGFRPFLGSSVSSLRDREAPLGDLLGVDDVPVATRLLDARVPVEQAAVELGAWLEALPREESPYLSSMTSLVAAAETDPDLTRAEHLAERAGCSLRTLQRRFCEYVGVGPKWVVQRCRLLDVAAAARGAEPVDWAGLAARFGYADQSHLIRIFTALVGQPPAAYAAAD